MKKRGQITVFIIIGLAVLILFGIYVYISRNNSNANFSALSIQERDMEIISNYVETCLKAVSEEALFERLGLQGGYINLDGDVRYGESAISSPLPAIMQGKKVPYYLEGSGTPPDMAYTTFLPGLNEIEKKLENYILVEFENCFNRDVFNEIGYEIKKPNLDYQSLNFDLTGTDVNIDVNFNEKGTSISFTYPLVVKLGAKQTVLEEFNIFLPIAFKSLYESAVALAGNARNPQPNAYDISADCSLYDKNGITNVYLKTGGDSSSTIVQLVDFSTYQNNYFNSFIFQFAMKNVNVVGNCVG